MSEGKMRKIDGAAAVRARPGDESVACAYLDLVAAAKLGDHANLVALRELGQRLVHQVSHVLASPAHEAVARARVPSDVTQSGDRGKQIPRRGRESQSPASVDLANAAADVHHGCVHYPRSLVHTLRVRCVATPRAPYPTACAPPSPPPPGFPATPSQDPHLKIYPPIIADKYAAPPDPKEEMYVPMKVVVVGDGAVGKTSMLLCYTTNTFPTDYMATVFDNYAVNVPYGNQVVSLGLWDTAGQEEYARYRPLSYDKADGFILAFDLTSRKSMENVHRRWIKELRAQAPGAPVVLVGTKLDLRGANGGDVDGCVATKEGEAVGKKIGAERYVECSALTQDNLGAVFDSAVDVCMKRRAALRDKGERNQGAQASGCCSIS